MGGVHLGFAYGWGGGWIWGKRKAAKGWMERERGIGKLGLVLVFSLGLWYHGVFACVGMLYVVEDRSRFGISLTYHY